MIPLSIASRVVFLGFLSLDTSMEKRIDLLIGGCTCVLTLGEKSFFFSLGEERLIAEGHPTRLLQRGENSTMSCCSSSEGSPVVTASTQ